MSFHNWIILAKPIFIQEARLMSSYNSIPYESLPVSYTYLPHLAALGKLYGLESVDPEQCRVLEIGCAEGNNIIPMSAYYPDSQFAGIDLAERQIQSGLKMIKRLGLNNIQLEVEDVANLDCKAYKPFDYILLHGVFSWVPLALQDIILQKAKSLLSANGIIYVSYNTYPGWHTQMVLRDALLYYCKDADPVTEISRIPEAIDYFQDFFKTADNTFSDYLVKRLQTLEKHPEKYLYHEFLETNNHPLYFSSFIKAANDNGLQYLTDALQAFDNTTLLGEKRNTFLKKYQNRIEKLQYMDFMINQRFRRSLLCHDHHVIREQFSPEHMTDVAFRGRLHSKGELKLNSTRPCKIYQARDPDIFLKITHPASKAAVQILFKVYPSSLHFMDLLQQACQRVADHHGMRFLEQMEPFYQELHLLVSNDWITLDNKPKHFPQCDPEQKPTLSRLSLEYAEQAGFVPTFLQQAIDINQEELLFLQLVNGAENEKQIVKNALKAITKEHISARSSVLNSSPINRITQHHSVKKRIKTLLAVLKKNALIQP